MRIFCRIFGGISLVDVFSSVNDICRHHFCDL
jgi:hypothetical protein